MHSLGCLACLLQLLQQGLALASEGLKHISTWSAHINELHSWKLSKYQPQPLRRVNAKAVTAASHLSLRQQYTPQKSVDTVAMAQQQSETAQLGQQTSGIPQPEGQIKLEPESGVLAMTAAQQQAAENQAQLEPASSTLAEAAAQQQAAELSADQITSHLQQLTPSQRLAQSSALKAALAAATAATPGGTPGQASQPLAGTPTPAGQAHSSAAVLSASPAAQAACAHISPEPSWSPALSPTQATQQHSALGTGEVFTTNAETAASPVSPQIVAETQAVTLQSVPVSPDTAQASSLHLQQQPVMHALQNVTPVAQHQRSVSVLSGPVSTAPVPVSIPTATGITTADAPVMLQPTSSSPALGPTVNTMGLSAPAGVIQPHAERNVVPEPASAAAAPMLRPVGAFSYTAPPMATAATLALTDRYMPAVGFSPSRARVAKELPSDASLGHLRRQSLATSMVDQPSGGPLEQGQQLSSASAVVPSLDTLTASQPVDTVPRVSEAARELPITAATAQPVVPATAPVQVAVVESLSASAIPAAAVPTSLESQAVLPAPVSTPSVPTAAPIASVPADAVTSVRPQTRDNDWISPSSRPPAAIVESAAFAAASPAQAPVATPASIPVPPALALGNVHVASEEPISPSSRPPTAIAEAFAALVTPQTVNAGPLSYSPTAPVAITPVLTVAQPQLVQQPNQAGAFGVNTARGLPLTEQATVHAPGSISTPLAQAAPSPMASPQAAAGSPAPTVASATLQQPPTQPRQAPSAVMSALPASPAAPVASAEVVSALPASPAAPVADAGVVLEGTDPSGAPAAVATPHPVVVELLQVSLSCIDC